MSVKNRINRLENASANAGDNSKVAFITYGRSGETKAEAIAEWEAENGLLSDCLAVFFTTYQTKPVDT